MGVYAGAWIGGVASTAYNYVRFYIPKSTTIHVTAKLEYQGSTIRWGVGPIATLRAVYSLDRQEYQAVRDLDQTLLDNMIANLIEAGFIAGGAFWGSASAVEKIGRLASVIKGSWHAAYALNSLRDWTESARRSNSLRYATVRFSVPVRPGQHTLAIGVEATASSNSIGNAFTICLANITSIRVKWN